MIDSLKAISFTKYSGCGNDFILVDDRQQLFPIADSEGIKRMCHRRYGVGADGVILLQSSEDADLRMRIFNADGYEAEMCGNGIRCLMRFAQTLGIVNEQSLVETLAGKKFVQATAEGIAVDMGIPVEMQWNLQVPTDELFEGLPLLNGLPLEVHFLNTGVPHAVLVTDNVANIDMIAIGRYIRNHTVFAPAGTNLNAVALEDGKVWNRTYERGVEDETLACGTGCVAAALAAHRLYGLPSPVSVMTRSGQELQISFQVEGESFEKVSMFGTADKIFEGSFLL